MIKGLLLVQISLSCTGTNATYECNRTENKRGSADIGSMPWELAQLKQCRVLENLQLCTLLFPVPHSPDAN